MSLSVRYKAAFLYIKIHISNAQKCSLYCLMREAFAVLSLLRLLTPCDYTMHDVASGIVD